ncbi:MAG: hypothetical protein M5U01_36065 [Ardenticatenaceae bacterium]|nr:hypothetical protein [Ardenticatenaceae bacterium]HBY97573.1 hypothetical protein [Chloroflexota bacterium]
MKVWIDRNKCESNLAACESCFGDLVVSGVPNRACIMNYEDDGSETMTVFMHSENHDETLVIPPEMREEVAYNGWTEYVHFLPEFRKNEGTERLKRAGILRDA